MLEILAPALVAAVVSLLISWQTMRMQQEQQRKELQSQRESFERGLQAQREYLEQELRAERQRQERDLERRFTEKLYDLRLDAYPKAFEITDKLRSEYVFSDDEELTRDTLKEVRADLLNWKKTEASFILSQDSLKSFYNIRKALGMAPEDSGKFSENQKKHIWECKNRFRAALRDDVGLLYAEEDESF